MSDTMTPVAKDDPRWLAWQRYVRTPDFGNTRSWPVKGPEYIDGALWAAFIVGWESAVRAVAPAGAPSEALTRSRVEHWLRNRRLRLKADFDDEALPVGTTCDVLMALLEDLYVGAAAPRDAPPGDSG